MLRNGLRKVAEDRQEWAGIPMPLDNEHLVVEPTYPKAQELMDMFRNPPEPSKYDDAKIRNTFYSMSSRGDIVIFEHQGKIDWGIDRDIHHFELDLHTLGCADAWGVEQEAAALQTLAGVLKHRAFKAYLLTGTFLEKSERSGVTYMFRRLKPTVAMTAVDGHVFRSRREGMRILCTLCLHPIGYYRGSWAGAMTPSDDVIAHLMLMRGDEHMFWKRANQCPAWRKEAGL